MGRILLSGASRLSGVFFSRFRLRSHVPIVLSHPFSSTPIMASANSLTASVQALTLQSTTQTSKFAGCFPSLNPMDIYREHIAEQLGKAADIDPELIFSRLAWTNTLDKGDLSLPVRLRFVACVVVDWPAVSRFPGSHGPSSRIGRRPSYQEEARRARRGAGLQISRVRPHSSSHRFRPSHSILLQAWSLGQDGSWPRPGREGRLWHQR